MRLLILEKNRDIMKYKNEWYFRIGIKLKDLKV